MDKGNIHLNKLIQIQKNLDHRLFSFLFYTIIFGMNNTVAWNCLNFTHLVEKYHIKVGIQFVLQFLNTVALIASSSKMFQVSITSVCGLFN